MTGFKHLAATSPGLEVFDCRTKTKHLVAIEEGNVVNATDIAKIAVDGKALMIYDPSFGNTISTKTMISNVDGDNGILEYRGYKIQDLAHLPFETVVYLLFEGSFPNRAEVKKLREDLAQYGRVPDRVRKIIAAFPRNAHPMTMLMASMASLAAEFPQLNPAVSGPATYSDPSVVKMAARRCFALSTALCGTIARHLKGFDVINFELIEHEPMTILERFFTFLIRENTNDLTMPDPQMIKIATSLSVLHAEHGLNCSTAAVLHLTSSGVDIFSAISGATGALYGPLHGGAAEKSLTMIRGIGSPGNVPNFMQKVKNKEEKLMGFGHRIYKTTDPRANIIEGLALAAKDTVTASDPLLDTAHMLRDKALQDEYFVSRQLFPNVDYFSGLIYRSFNIPDDHFTMMFALSRCSGWLAHWVAFQGADTKTKRIWRPQSIYVGPHFNQLPPIEREQD